MILHVVVFVFEVSLLHELTDLGDVVSEDEEDGEDDDDDHRPGQEGAGADVSVADGARGDDHEVEGVQVPDVQRK